MNIEIILPEEVDLTFNYKIRDDYDIKRYGAGQWVGDLEVTEIDGKVLFDYSFENGNNLSDMTDDVIFPVLFEDALFQQNNILCWLYNYEMVNMSFVKRHSKEQTDEQTKLFFEKYYPDGL